MKTKYTLICGMEIHAELKTASKMFCGCKNDPFGAPKPNMYTCPVCLGMPGGLPVANKKAIEWTIKLGLALNCKINLFSHFDRKHYFYPDLPKGYQISQYDLPFCYDGHLDTEYGPVRIRRIHLEEDTGKLIHRSVDGKKVSLIDFNRSSVPLVEIVTEPDMHTPEHAKAYGKNIRQILRFLDIADCDMEQGGMRLEANVSLSEDPAQLPPYKVELKNINSFRFLEKAVQFEIGRQTEIVEKGEIPIQETRGWNDTKGQTFSQRVKEDAEDYRYFPDPDLPPMRFTQKQIEDIRAQLPELPADMKVRWQKEYGVETKYADVLTEEREQAVWAEIVFKEAKKLGADPNGVANAIVNKKVSIDGFTPAQIVENWKLTQQTDTIPDAELIQIIQTAIKTNPDAVAQFKKGKTQVVGFFMGQILRTLGKKIDTKILSAKILDQLQKE